MPPQGHRILKLVGDQIREHRERLGWTQQRLAAEAGLDMGYVSDIELGKRNVSLLVFLQIVRALRVKASDILD